MPGDPGLCGCRSLKFRTSLRAPPLPLTTDEEALEPELDEPASIPTPALAAFDLATAAKKEAVLVLEDDETGNSRLVAGMAAIEPEPEPEPDDDDAEARCLGVSGLDCCWGAGSGCVTGCDCASADDERPPWPLPP